MRGFALAASSGFFPHPVMASAQATEMTTGRNFFLILVPVIIRSRIFLRLVMRHRMHSARAFAKIAFPAARGESPSRRSLYAEFRWQAKQMFQKKRFSHGCAPGKGAMIRNQNSGSMNQRGKLPHQPGPNQFHNKTDSVVAETVCPSWAIQAESEIVQTSATDFWLNGEVNRHRLP